VTVVETPVRVLVAGRVVTMDPVQPFAEAVAVQGDVILAVDSLAACRSLYPSASIVNTGAAALLPGFVAPDASPMLASAAMMPPRYYIAPWVAPSWANVVAVFRHAISVTPPSSALMFYGFDPTLHGRALPVAGELDSIFGDRMVAVVDRSGQSGAVTSRVLEFLGWTSDPPIDPANGRYGRRTDGRLDGTAFGASSVAAISEAVLTATHIDALLPAAQYFALMSEVGYTTTAELNYRASLRPTYEALGRLSDNPLRVALYHAATDGDAFVAAGPAVDGRRMRKQGVQVQIDESWTSRELDLPHLESLLSAAAYLGTQVVISVRETAAFDIALDACEQALSEAAMTDTDHRWRLEGVAGATALQVERMTRLGLLSSLSPLDFYYWGDRHRQGVEAGSRTGRHDHRFREVHDFGRRPYFRSSDVSFPISPLLAIQTAVSRLTNGGVVRELEQSVSLTEALKAQTMNAAHAIGLDSQIGSIAPGKFADFVELSADPYGVPAGALAREITVQGTWVAGEKVDLSRFLTAARPEDAGPCVTQPIPVHYLAPRDATRAIA
jgi:predicted amidohydrolase YtcJ